MGLCSLSITPGEGTGICEKMTAPGSYVCLNLRLNENIRHHLLPLPSYLYHPIKCQRKLGWRSCRRQMLCCTKGKTEVKWGDPTSSRKQFKPSPTSDYMDMNLYPNGQLDRNMCSFLSITMIYLNIYCFV